MTSSSQFSPYSRVTFSTLAALVGIQVTFASNYLFSKIVMNSIPPLVWGFLRTLSTALILLLVLYFKKQLNLPRVWEFRRQLILFALLGVVLNQAAFLLGLKLTTTANSGLINTMIPVFTILWATLFQKESFSLLRWLGFALAFGGVLFLQDLSHFSISSATYQGDAFTLLNAFSYSLFLFLSPPFFRNESPLWTTAWLFAIGSVGLAFCSIPQWSHYDFSSFSSSTVIFAILGIFLGNLVPYLLISYVLAKTSSSIVAQFVYLQALIAGLLGVLFLGESISERTIFSALAIFFGLYLSLMK
ncbi:MAG: DMT family transporter [Pseudomonadota bacterium]